MNNETIKRSEVINAIKTLHNILGDAGTKAAVMALDGIPAAGEWISVKDRLPISGQTVLCIGPKGKQFIATNLRIENATNDGKIWINGAGWRTFSHWMPLPDAPKEE